MNDNAPATILLATDDSESARIAEAWVQRSRWESPPTVDVVCIGDPGELRLGWWTNAGPGGDQVADDVRHAELIAAQAVGNAVAERLQHEGHVARSWASQGETVEELLRLADHIGPDLIAVGSRGRSQLGRLLLGSVSAGLVRSARHPVVVVRHLPQGERPLPQRIVIASRAEAGLNAVLDWLASVRLAAEAEVLLLGLGGGSSQFADAQPDHPNGASERLRGLASRRLEALGVASVSSQLVMRHPLEAVVDASERHAADLVIVPRIAAARGKSLAEQVAEQVPTATLVIPASG